MGYFEYIHEFCLTTGRHGLHVRNNLVAIVYNQLASSLLPLISERSLQVLAHNHQESVLDIRGTALFDNNPGLCLLVFGVAALWHLERFFRLRLRASAFGYRRIW